MIKILNVYKFINKFEILEILNDRFIGRFKYLTDFFKINYIEIELHNVPSESIQQLYLNSEIAFKVRHYYEKTCFFGTFFAQSEKCSENKIDIEKTKKIAWAYRYYLLIKKPIEKSLFFQELGLKNEGGRYIPPVARGLNVENIFLNELLQKIFGNPLD